MSTLIQVLVVLALAALLAVAARLVPLLGQLDRTARALEALASEARLDLRRMSEDVRQARVRAESLAGSLQEGLEVPRALFGLGLRIVEALRGLLPRNLPAPSLGRALLAGAALLASLRRRRRARAAR